MIFFILIIFRYLYFIIQFGKALNDQSLLVQGIVIGYRFKLAPKEYDNHHCHNKPQTGNVVEVWMTSCPEETVLRIWRFWKRVSWRLTLDHGGRVVEFSAIEAVSWVFGRCGGGKVFRISTGRDELRSKTPRDMVNVGGGLSIVWLRQTFKNWASLLVSKNRSQKLIKRSYLNNRIRLFLLVFAYIYIQYMCTCICIHMYVVYVYISQMYTCRTSGRTKSKISEF